MTGWGPWWGKSIGAVNASGPKSQQPTFAVYGGPLDGQQVPYTGEVFRVMITGMFRPKHGTYVYRLVESDPNEPMHYVIY